MVTTLRGDILRYSKQRTLILDTIKDKKTHLTANEVYNLVREKQDNISLGTVYRNLNSLVEYGLIKKIEIPNDSDYFDFNICDHSHMYCSKCGKVFDIDNKSIDGIKESIEKYYSYKIESYNIVLQGLCEDCK